MRITNLVILLFLLSAFTIGIALQDEDLTTIDRSIDNVSISINSINLTSSAIDDSSIPNIKGIYLVLEKYIHFIGTFALEVLRTGVKFGHDNPNYFESENIIHVIKLIIILVIISLLIKPLMYLIIFIVMIILWIVNKVKEKNYETNKRNKHRRR